jgi:hypothetical protein
MSSTGSDLRTCLGAFQHRSLDKSEASAEWIFALNYPLSKVEAPEDEAKVSSCPRDLLNPLPAATTTITAEAEETIDGDRVTTVLKLVAPRNSGVAIMNQIEMVSATCDTMDTKYLEGIHHRQLKKRRKKGLNILLSC